MKKIIVTLIMASSVIFFSQNVAISGGTTKALSTIIKESGKKIGKFFSKKPIDKKTGGLMVGGAAVTDGRNNKDSKK